MYRLYIFLVVFPLISFSQINEGDILFKINNQPVLAEEFIRVYNKNIELIEDKSQKDIDNYLELYINYKLKLSDAYLRKLDQKDTYKSELNKYSKQLESSFLTDKITEEKLILEAYDRTKQEVNVSHILIRIDEDNNDTINIYNRVLNLRKSLLKNNIDSLIETYHNGKDIIIENLGYFSAFKMIYKFENIAYNTKVGEVSMPFRTRFGYHILKVNDKRPSLGEITVGHIMTYKNNQGAKEKIYSLYDSIYNGSNFELLAKKYSEDKNTSYKGGRLNPFSSGQLNSPEFENMAFSLKNQNETSLPFETKIGWHIIKFYSKSKLKPIAEMKPVLSNKIKRNSRSTIISDSFYQMLLDKYDINYNNKNLKYFEPMINQEYFNNSWIIPDDLDKDSILIIIRNKTYSFLDFATYIYENQGNTKSQIKENVINSLYKEFINNNLIEIYKSNLEDENKDYKYILKEYKEGLLLFDLMKEKIWNVASNDSIKMKEFYELNKLNYNSFNEDKGEIIGDYQDFLENSWIKKLRAENSIVVNKRVLRRIKKILENNE